MKKLSKFDRCLAGGILQAPVDEQGIVTDPETGIAIGKCQAPEFKQEKDCVIIELSAQPFKPLKSITCDITVDRSEDE